MITENLYKESKTMSISDVFPYGDNDKYATLLKRFMHSDATNSNEFIIGEALKIYSELTPDDRELKIRVLELLKDLHF